MFSIDTAEYDAVIFDLDGVVTRTARVHAAAWKKLFDEYLAKRQGEGYRPFDPDSDYRQYVDGKPRYDGVQSFLASRDIDLPYGSPEDSIDIETVCGLGNRKNAYFHTYLKREGVAVYDAATDLIRRLRDAGIRTAVVSSSKNCVPVLKAAGIADLFDAKIDGIDAEKRELAGKPAPDIFLESASELKVDPGRAIVVEDALAGVEAGKRGNFGCVIGVDRGDHGEALKQHGADVAVTDLSRIHVGQQAGGTSTHDLPSALDAKHEISQQLVEGSAALFFDYDGTLTPIVPRPEDAVLSDAMRQVLKDLSERFFVAVISGRDLPDVKQKVGLDAIFYAGSHGFDIAGPKGRHIEAQQGTSFLPDLDEAQEDLEERLGNISGAMLERKKFSIAIHYRNVAEGRASDVSEIVDRVHARHPRLRKSSGKKVYELQPDVDWNKGEALLWLLDKLGPDRSDVIPMYMGDDVTDEDAFKALPDRGIGIVVQEAPRPTAAQYRLKDPDEVQRFLSEM